MLFLILGAFFFPSPGLRAEDTAPETRAARSLQQFYQGLDSMTFDFTQTTRVGGRERYGSGNAAFARTTLSGEQQSIMRWNYTEPDRQVIINDGTTLSIYTHRDRQLIQTPSRELESDITYAFFAGNRDLLEDFAAQPADGNFTYSSPENLQAVKLVPRQPHNQIRSVTIWYDEGNIIRHILIEDHFDSITELNFENVSLNSVDVGNEKVIEDIISFSIPPGTEIISQ